jgi:hypothetical protein
MFLGELMAKNSRELGHLLEQLVTLFLQSLFAPLPQHIALNEIA